jgi:hypothetical protein
VPKGLSAPIFVDLYPSTAVRRTGVLQGQRDGAKGTPAACIKEVRLGGSKRIGPSIVIVAKGRVMRRRERSRESEIHGDRGSAETGQLALPAVSTQTASRTTIIRPRAS